MKYFFVILLFGYLNSASAKSISLSVQDTYFQSYFWESSVILNDPKKISIQLNSDGLGEYQLPKRQYDLEPPAPLVSEAQVDQTIYVEYSSKKCQVTFHTKMNLHYCAYIEIDLEPNKDCVIDKEIEQSDTWSCSDLADKRKVVNATTHFVQDNERSNYYYHFNNNFSAGELETP